MHRPFCCLILPGLLVTLLAVHSSAADKTAADLLPESTVAYLEIPQPGKILDTVLDHPLAEEVRNHPDYQKALASAQYEKFFAALKHVEDKLGMKWRDGAKALTSGGTYVGFDLPTQGVAVLTQAQDEALAIKARDTALELARAAASANGQPDPVKQEELRGVTVYQIGEAHIAVLGKWLLASNKQPLVFMIIENHLSDNETLADDAQFQQVLKDRGSAPDAWAYVDLRVLRLTGILRNALNKKSDNPGIELIAGGAIGALPDAPYATASLTLDSSRLKLTAAIPCDPKVVAKKREFFFGVDGNGVAPPLLQPKDTLLSLSTYRDLGSMWRNAPDLFDEGVNAQLAEAESGLTTIFAGRNFRDDILGNLEPGLQLVVTRQQFPQAGVTPTIKLPAGAIVVRMKKPEETQRIFKITFQSAVGFLNVAGAMNGASPLDLNTERIGDALVISTEYLPPEKQESLSEAPIHHNASPTAVFVGDRFILSSAKPLALELMEAVKHEEPATPGVNSAIAINGKAVQAILAENRDSLIAQNMIEKGHDRGAGEKEIDGLLKALTFIQESSARLTSDGKELELSLEVVLAGSK